MFQDQFCCSFVCILSVIDWFFGCTASKIEKKRIFFVILLCGGKCMYSIKLNGNAFLLYGLICVEVIVVANIQSGLIWFCIFSHYIYLTVIFFFFFLFKCMQYCLGNIYTYQTWLAGKIQGAGQDHTIFLRIIFSSGSSITQCNLGLKVQLPHIFCRMVMFFLNWYYGRFGFLKGLAIGAWSHLFLLILLPYSGSSIAQGSLGLEVQLPPMFCRLIMFFLNYYYGLIGFLKGRAICAWSHLLLLILLPYSGSSIAQGNLGLNVQLNHIFCRLILFFLNQYYGRIGSGYMRIIPPAALGQAPRGLLQLPPPPNLNVLMNSRPPNGPLSPPPPIIPDLRPPAAPGLDPPWNIPGMDAACTIWSPNARANNFFLKKICIYWMC